MSVTDKSLTVSCSLTISHGYCFLAEKPFLPLPQSSESRFGKEGFSFLPQEQGSYLIAQEMLPGPTDIKSCPQLPQHCRSEAKHEAPHHKGILGFRITESNEQVPDLDAAGGGWQTPGPRLSRESVSSTLALPGMNLSRHQGQDSFAEQRASQRACWQQLRLQEKEIIWLLCP